MLQTRTVTKRSIYITSCLMAVFVCGRAFSQGHSREFLSPGTTRGSLISAPTHAMVRVRFDCVVGKDHVAQECQVRAASARLPMDYSPALERLKHSLRVPAGSHAVGSHVYPTATLILKDQVRSFSESSGER